MSLCPDHQKRGHVASALGRLLEECAHSKRAINALGEADALRPYVWARVEAIEGIARHLRRAVEAA